MPERKKENKDARSHYKNKNKTKNDKIWPVFLRPINDSFVNKILGSLNTFHRPYLCCQGGSAEGDADFVFPDNCISEYIQLVIKLFK